MWAGLDQRKKWLHSRNKKYPDFSQVQFSLGKLVLWIQRNPKYLGAPPSPPPEFCTLQLLSSLTWKGKKNFCVSCLFININKNIRDFKLSPRGTWLFIPVKSGISVVCSTTPLGWQNTHLTVLLFVASFFNNRKVTQCHIIFIVDRTFFNNGKVIQCHILFIFTASCLDYCS